MDDGEHDGGGGRRMNDFEKWLRSDGLLIIILSLALLSVVAAKPRCRSPISGTLTVGSAIDFPFDWATTTRSIQFSEYGHEVAALVYDKDAQVCRQTGSIVDAFRVVSAELALVSEERDRCRYGDKQVDEWKRRGK